MIDHLSARFLDFYGPQREVAVDEVMIKFARRSTLKQFMPMKPVKRGIKVWALADSHNGYFHKFQVYRGKERSRVKQLGQRVVVKDLTQHLKRRNDHVFLITFSPVRSCCVTWPTMTSTLVGRRIRTTKAFLQH